MNPMLQIKSVTLDQARNAGCDCVQYKYKGPTVTNTIDGVNLLGSAHPSGLTFFWDCLSSHGTPAKHFSYRDRYALTYLQIAQLTNPEHRAMLKCVKNHPLDATKEIWSKLDSNLHCGIIFRRSHGLWDDELFCQRWYPEVPKDLE